MTADKDPSSALANGGGSGGGGGGARKFPRTRLWRQSQDRYAWRADVTGAGTAARVAFNAVRLWICFPGCRLLLQSNLLAA